MKTTFLFWNLNRRSLLPLVAELSHAHDVDILILAEYGGSDYDLVLHLNARPDTTRTYTLPMSYTNHLKIATRLPVDAVEPVADIGRMTIRRIKPPIGIEVTLVAAHLPSKLYQSDQAQALACVDMARDIRAVEETVGHARTFVMGDLNMNPFEAGMVGRRGLHAVMTRSLTTGRVRRLGSDERPYFYNPMWSFFGDSSLGPPGTYFHPSPGEHDTYWHMFDQVLVRGELLANFDNTDLQIVTAVGDRSLLTRSGRPDRRFGSDHLPILFKLDLEKEATR